MARKELLDLALAVELGATSPETAAKVMRKAAAEMQSALDALRMAAYSLDDAVRAPKVKHNRVHEAKQIFAYLREQGVKA